MTYIVRFGGSPQVGVMQSEGKKTYIVHEVFFVGFGIRELSRNQHWRKSECAVATEKTLELVRNFKVFEAGYHERMRALREEQREYAKPLLDEIRASTQQPQETLPG